MSKYEHRDTLYLRTLIIFVYEITWIIIGMKNCNCSAITPKAFSHVRDGQNTYLPHCVGVCVGVCGRVCVWACVWACVCGHVECSVYYCYYGYDLQYDYSYDYSYDYEYDYDYD